MRVEVDLFIWGKGRKPLFCFQPNQLWKDLFARIALTRGDQEETKRPLVLLHVLVIHMLVLDSVKWRSFDIQYPCGFLFSRKQLIFMSWTPQIPFQLGLSKTDLRRVLKSSLSGVSRQRSCFMTAMQLCAFYQTNYTRWKLPCHFH